MNFLMAPPAIFYIKYANCLMSSIERYKVCGFKLNMDLNWSITYSISNLNSIHKVLYVLLDTVCILNGYSSLDSQPSVQCCWGRGCGVMLVWTLVRCKQGPDKRWEMLICVYCIISSGHAAVRGAAQQSHQQFYYWFLSLLAIDMMICFAVLAQRTSTDDTIYW